MPQISIGMPVYNGEQFLQEALDSILGQSFEDFELIISDNASTDSTEDICRGYLAMDRRVRYYRNEDNLGASRNYNLVFRYAGADFFKWAAHDDLLAPGFLQQCLEKMNGAPADVVLCYARRMTIDSDGNFLGKYDDNMDIRYGNPERRLGHLVRNLRGTNALFGLIRSSVLKQTHLIGSYFASDHTLLLELCLRGKFWQIDEPLFYRRVHPDSCRRANNSYEDVAVWFDPQNKGKCIIPMSKLFYESLKLIGQSGLSFYDKITCYNVLIEEWLRRYWRQMGGEAKMVLKQLLQRKLKKLDIP